MHARNDGIGFHLSSRLYIGFDLYRVDVVYDVGLGGVDSVSVVGVSQ